MRVTTIALLLASSGIFGCSGRHHSGDVTMKDPSVEADLKALQGKRILFGHQSVGGNILDGMKDLEQANPAGKLAVVDLAKSPAPSGPFLGELSIGRNGHPSTKCDEFSAKVRSLGNDGLDLAIMKFCFADFTQTTDVAAVMAGYAAMVDSLRVASPRLVIVHTTVPLDARTQGWKKMIKRVLGKEELSDIRNAKRCEFNEMLKARFGNDPMFDLAGVESTYPDGTREEFTFEGKTVYALVRSYSEDGSHLNSIGSVRAARDFVHTLARVAGTGTR
jgi:hypothetical protein